MADNQHVPADDDGTIDDLVNSLTEEPATPDRESGETGEAVAETAGEPEQIAAAEGAADEESTSSPTGGATADQPEESGEAQSSVPGDDLEALRRDATFGRTLGERLVAQIQEGRRKQAEEAEKGRIKAFEESLSSLINANDETAAIEQARTILSDARTDVANRYLPQIDQIERQFETASQGVVVLHEAARRFVPPDQWEAFEAFRDELLAFNSADELTRELQYRDQSETVIAERTRTLTEENDALKLRVAALERAQSGVDNLGASEGDPIGIVVDKDDGSIEALVESLY